MRRFYRGSSSDTTKLLFSLILFLCIGCIFYLGILALGDETNEKQRESLETAIQQGIVHCYATEGRYPESLDYLKETYGIRYDSDKYFVDYQILGANILPDITIIDRQEAKHE